MKRLAVVLAILLLGLVSAPSAMADRDLEPGSAGVTFVVR